MSWVAGEFGAVHQELRWPRQLLRHLIVTASLLVSNKQDLYMMNEIFSREINRYMSIFKPRHFKLSTGVPRI